MLEVKKEEKNKKNIAPDDDEETLMYKPAPAMKYINDGESIYNKSDTRSLNTAPSVFDRTAVFKSENM